MWDMASARPRVANAASALCEKDTGSFVASVGGAPGHRRAGRTTSDVGLAANRAPRFGTFGPNLSPGRTVRPASPQRLARRVDL